MSATPPQQLEGTQSPSQIEFLWERYRRPFQIAVVLLLLVVAGFYVAKWMKQTETNAQWSGFAVNTGLERSYTDLDWVAKSLTDSLDKLDAAKLDQALASADANQAPYVLLAIARKAMQDRNWERADKALADLESKFPKHSLVLSTSYPVQVREVVKKDEPDDATSRAKKPELKPQKAGSPVSLLREQIASAKAFTAPSHFAKPEIPADAPKYKFDFSDGSSFTIALMVAKAPKHCAEFQNLAKQEGGAFWVGLSIDEIRRNGTGMARNPKQLHLGFETTKEAERSKWTKTDPSKHQVDFEPNDLSHFEGAVAARTEADGKSCADRFWVCGEDAAEEDGSRVVFGYVVDGLANVKKICEASMSAQEDEAGVGMPADKVTVTAVALVQ